jgi:hypothetical protein
MSNFIKIPPMVAELFHADRPTNMAKLVDAFSNFPNASIKVTILRSAFSSLEGEGGWCHVVVIALLTKEQTENVKKIVFDFLSH